MVQTITRPTSHCPTYGRLILRSFLTAVLLCFAALPTAAHDIRLFADDQPITELTIGTDLFAGLENALPETTYDLVLLDEADEAVSELQLTTDSAGKAYPYRLWKRTGIIGCSAPFLADWADLTHESHTDAETNLNGRTLSVVARLADTTAEVAQIDLPIDTTTRPVHYFLSDAFGCLIEGADVGDAMYLSGYNVPSGQTHIYFFLVIAQNNWQTGMPLADVRPPYQTSPQLIFLPAGGGSLPHMIWLAAVAGTYDGIVRSGGTPGTSYLANGDDLIDENGGGGKIPSCWECDPIPPCPGCSLD